MSFFPASGICQTFPTLLSNPWRNFASGLSIRALAPCIVYPLCNIHSLRTKSFLWKEVHSFPQALASSGFPSAISKLPSWHRTSNSPSHQAWQQSTLQLLRKPPYPSEPIQQAARLYVLRQERKVHMGNTSQQNRSNPYWKHEKLCLQ